MRFGRENYITKLSNIKHNGLIKIVTGLRCVGVPSMDASSPEYIPVGGLIFQYANQVTGRWGYENKSSKVTSLWTMPE
jgi:hypothetical protein